MTRKRFNVSILGSLVVDSDDLVFDDVEEGSEEWEMAMREHAEDLAQEAADSTSLIETQVDVDDAP